MIKNDNGEKVSAKKLVQDAFAESVKAAGDGLSSNVDEFGTERGLTDREKGLVKDQIAKLTKRVMRILGEKEDKAEAEKAA